MKILSIRGGGIRGLAPATLFRDIEDMTGRPFASNFDLIAGTSTGGILAIALGLGISARQIVEFYLEDGPAIFKRRLLHRFGLTGSKYDSKVLQAALQKRFAGRQFSSCNVKTMVTTTDLQTLGARFLKSWEITKEVDYEAWMPALATSAAPTYFDAVAGRYVDGGLFANDPALYALAEACQLQDLPKSLAMGNVKILDVACPRPKEQAVKGGDALEFAPRAFDVVLESGMDAVEEACKRFIGANYLKIEPDLTPVWPELGVAASPALDDASKVNLLALQNVGRAATKKYTKQILDFIK